MQAKDCHHNCMIFRNQLLIYNIIIFIKFIFPYFIMLSIASPSLLFYETIRFHPTYTYSTFLLQAILRSGIHHPAITESNLKSYICIILQITFTPFKGLNKTIYEQQQYLNND